MLHSHPGAARKAAPDFVILKRDQNPVHRNVAEHKNQNERRDDHQLQVKLSHESQEPILPTVPE
ncbi:hypothetical protein D1872_306560 [compost metagenome]